MPHTVNVKRKKQQICYKPGRKHLWRSWCHFGLPVKHEHIALCMGNSLRAVGGRLHNSYQHFKAVQQKRKREEKTFSQKSSHCFAPNVLYSFKQKLPLWSSQGFLAFARFLMFLGLRWLKQVIKTLAAGFSIVFLQLLKIGCISLSYRRQLRIGSATYFGINITGSAGGGFLRKICNLYLLLFSSVQLLAWKKYPVVSGTLQLCLHL